LALFPGWLVKTRINVKEVKNALQALLSTPRNKLETLLSSRIHGAAHCNTMFF
jgi:hypothetical protein